MDEEKKLLNHDELLALVEKRRLARERQDFAEADAIKREVEAGGYWLKDHSDGGTSYDRILPQMNATLQIAMGSENAPAPKPVTTEVTQLKALPKSKKSAS